MILHDLRAWLFGRAAPFEVGVPPRARSAIEAVYVASLVFAASLAGLSSIASWLVPVVLFAGGVALVRPWSAAHGGAMARALTSLLLFVGLAVAVLVERPGLTEHTRIAAVAAFASGHLFVVLALRGVAVVIVVILLARGDGQSLGSLGLRRERLGRELGVGLLATGGAFAADIASAIPLAFFLVVSGTKGAAMGGGDVQRRAEGLGELLPHGGALAFALTAIFAAAFEEIVFRGFLLGRLKRVSGSWVVALLVASAIFGSGHLYEGFYAVFQTFVLGLFFGLLALRRGRVESAIVAHASFDAIIFAVAKLVLASSAMQDALKAMPK